MGMERAADTRCHARTSGHPGNPDGAIAGVAVPPTEKSAAEGEGAGRPSCPGRSRTLRPRKRMHRGVSAFAGQRRIALLHDPASAASPAGRHSGRIAQLVEQLTLNQRVLGSSPSAPTNKIKGLDPPAPNISRLG